MKNQHFKERQGFFTLIRQSTSRGVFLLLMVLLLVMNVTAIANPVSAERARLVAKNFLSNNGARSTGLTDITAETGFSHVYVFSTANSFVIMAADDCECPILGYSLNGGFDLENMPENKAAWIQEYSDGIRYAIDHQMRASSEVLQLWNDLAAGRPDAGRVVTVVSPLVQTLWDQGNPYNLLCPSSSVTGCVATAMAQVMKYWNYPEHGIGSHSYVHYNYGELSADFQSTTYDWTNMLNSYSGSSTQAQKMAVATLMYHCGVSVDMDYSPNGSGAGTAIVADALKTYFNFSSQTQHHSRSEYNDATWIAMLKADLDLNRPIQYHGSGSGGGHSFVFDGYNSNNYFHVNWGWGGYCDEYYQISNLNPGPGGIGSGSNGIYNDNQGAIFHAHPSDCVAGVPTNLTYTLSNRSITLNWNAANGAASYNIYCNNNFVANATTNTYTGTAPYGSSKYYVRSVDAAGELSLSSNAVTISVAYPVPVVDDLAANVTGNNIGLTWTAPDWCYPETPSATLNYGEGSVYYSWTYNYYAHRYLASDLAAYAGKAIYKVSTFVQYPGDYTAYVYTNSNGNQPMASALAVTKTIHSSSSNLWLDFDFDEPIILSGTADLWVVMNVQNTGATYPTPSFNLSSHNTNAFYAGSSPTSLYDGNSSSNCAWFINTFLTDGEYTFKLYRNGSCIANNVSSTSYDDNNLTPGLYEYYVKTNYYAGESPASNHVSVQIGAGNYMTITATANPTIGGTITGAGSYLQGSTCTLTATANEGYTFVNWTKNGTVVSTTATYSFTVTDPADLVANFEIATYAITVSANPDGGGTVSGGGTYNHFETCTLIASPNSGYNFVNWTMNGIEVSTDAVYSFTVTEDADFVANFEEEIPGGNVVTIGDGTGTTYYCPFNTLWGYSFVEQVYTADEIGTAGTITAISFNMRETDAAYSTDVDVFMKNVSRSYFSSQTDWETVTASDMVFSGTWNITPGWATITLDTPFLYDGTSNLMIGMHEKTSGYSTRYFYYTSVTGGMISGHSDSTDPNPYDMGSYTGTTYVQNYRANIQIDITTGGGGESGEITIHDGTATNSYVPVYGFYADAYLKAEFVYPAAELSTMNGGTINAMTFYTTSPAPEPWASTWQVFISEVADASISDFYGPGTVVYEGVLDGTGAEMTINFTTPYQYNGGNLLVGVYNITTGNYKSVTWAGETVDGASVQGYNYSSLSSVTATQRNFLPKTTFTYSIIIQEPTFVVTPDPIAMGYRPNGAWMRPFTVNVLNDGMTVTMNEVVANNAFFQVEAVDFEMPGELTHGRSFNVNLTTGTTEAGEINANLILAYDDNGTTQYELTATAYDPISPDVWELAELVTTFPFTDTLVVADIPLYDNYVMPLPDIADGADAVYQLVFTEDTYLNASVTSGDNGKVALYPEGFKGLGGPDMDNYYAGPQIGNVSLPFEAQIGEGTSTTGYFPFYTLYNYSIAECLFLADELAEAGVTSTPMTSLSWYATNAPGYLQQGITIWMANVDDEALTSASHVVTNMTMVYMGAITPEIGWNEFVFNVGDFSWDGNSNVLIYCQRNNGEWNSTVQWQATSGMPFTCMSYRYQDTGAYDPTISNSMYTSTTRPNIIMKGGNREGGNRASVPVTFNMTDSWGDGWNGGYIDVVENGVSVAQVTLPSGSSGSEIVELNEGAHVTLIWNAGLYDSEVFFTVEMLDDTIYSVSSPSAGYLYEFDIFGGGGYNLDGTITNMTVTPGTYYLVASSTSDEFVVEMDATEVPCPEIAYNPYPADGATEVNTPAVHLRWFLGDKTTEYRIMYGTTYYCEDTLIDWTRELSNNCWMTGLFNNTNYFWRIDQRNDGCPDGVRGEVWGFTTHLNVPPYLYAGNHYLQEGSYAYLYWGTPAERGLLSYNIYQDDVFIGNTSQDYFYIYDLPYNMNGYRFNVTAVYDEGESGYSSPCYIYVSGNGYVEGHVYEQDGVTPIANAFISLSGTDEFGYSSYFVFNTDDNGYYYGALKAGSYSATAICNGYQDKTYMGTVSVVYSSTTSNIDFVMDEKFYPVTEVVAQYFPDSLDLDSPFVKVYWGTNAGASSIEDFETGNFSKYDWQNDANYPWEISDNNPYDGSFCMKSGGAGVANVVSDIMVTVDIPADGEMSFYGKISSENNWDFGYFFIDGVQMGSYTGAGYWSEQLFAITSGEHTFQWRYTKDGSVNSNDDCFYVDYISFLKNPESASVGLRDYSDRDDNNSMVSSAGIKGASVQNGNRSFQYYRVYRTDAFNYGPYNTENTILLADHLTDTVYIDVAWQNLETGVYKYGVSCVYEGNRESAIRWNEQNNTHQHHNVSYTTDNVFADNGSTLFPMEMTPEMKEDLLNREKENPLRDAGILAYANCCYSTGVFPVGYLSFDLQNPSQYSTIGNLIVGRGGEYCAEDGYFYGLDNNRVFYKIDPTTGTVVDSHVLQNVYTQDMAYNYVDHTMYGTDGGILVTMDLATGAWAYIGDGYGIGTSMMTIAIDLEGNAYGIGLDGVFYSIDLTTGLASAIGNTGLTLNYIQCMGFDHNTETLYWFHYNSSTDNGLYTVDPATGACTLVMSNMGEVTSFFVPFELNPLQLPRESAISWSNPIDKNMLLGQDEVTISVMLNSADSPEGTVVSFVNQNEYEQQYYPIADVTLDATGYFAWESFRRGTYQVTVQHDGYETIIDNVSIMEPTDLSYVMTEIIYNPGNLYVSSTGWAMWDAEGMIASSNGGVSFSEDFEEGFANWTLIDGDGDSINWYHSSLSQTNSCYDYTGWGNNGSNGFAVSQSYTDCTYDPYQPNNFLVTNLKYSITASSALNFWADYGNDGYPDHFGIAVAVVDNPTPDDFIVVWEGNAKNNKVGKSEIRHSSNRYQNWRFHSVDLSAYAGQDVYIAFRHFNSYDLYEIFIDDVELTTGAKIDDRHLESFTVECTTLDGVLLFTTNTEQAFCQIPTDELVSGEHYIVKVAANYTTGLSDWNQVEWQYISCDNYDGTVNGVTIDGNEISWEYPVIQGGDSFTESWDDGLNGWTNIDNDGDGHMWYHSTEVGNHSTLAITSHSGEGHLMDESYCNATWNALMPDDYIVSPQQYAIGVGSTISLWACTQDVNYPSEHFGFAISMGSNTNASDFTTIAEWTITSKGTGNGIIGRAGRSSREGAWYQFSADLSDYAGQNVWIAVRHFNCTDQFILNIDDIELTNGGRSGNLRYGILGTMIFADGEVVDFVEYPTNTYVYEGNAREVSVRLVYNGTSNLPEGNNYYSMSCPESIGGNSEVTQTTDFAEGWNWWSTYIDQTGIDGLTMLEEGLGDNGSTIKSQGDGFVQYMTYGGYNFWYGTLDHMTNTQTYMVQTNAAVQVEMNGTAASPANSPITISEGWNWIGFPSANAMDFATAFSGITPMDGDIVKSQNSFAQYMVYGNYSFWYGELSSGVITPGMGLMYKSVNGESYTLTYPVVGRNDVVAEIPVEKHWTNNVHLYPANMTVLAVVELNDIELRSDSYELAAFANGEVRGSARLTYVEPLNRYMAFLTVSGNEAAELHFALYDAETGEENYTSSDKLVYETDAAVGSYDEPMVVSFRSTTGLDDIDRDLQVYPNPVERSERFSFNLPVGSEVRVEVVNALGAIISTETSAKAPASFVAPSTAGVYTLRIIVEGKETYCRKLIVR